MFFAVTGIASNGTVAVGNHADHHLSSGNRVSVHAPYMCVTCVKRADTATFARCHEQTSSDRKSFPGLLFAAGTSIDVALLHLLGIAGMVLLQGCYCRARYCNDRAQEWVDVQLQPAATVVCCKQSKPNTATSSNGAQQFQ